MHIIAGENNLTIMRQNVHRDNGVGLILKIEVARESIRIAELEAIVQDIGDNAHEITVYDDNGEKVAVLSGFHCEPNIYAKGGVYTVEFINASENTFQLGRHKLMLENLEQKAEKTKEEMEEQAEVINNQGAALVEQMGTIDAILTEVIAEAVTEAVSLATELAVEQVLATINGEQIAGEETEAEAGETVEE